MKKSKLFNVGLLCLLSSVIISVFGVNIALAKMQNVTFVNYSGKNIYFLYVSESSYNKWGQDLVGKGQVLYNGGSNSFRYNNKYRYYDIKVVFGDGSDAVWDNYDLRSAWKLTIYQDGSRYRIKKN